jgi:multidrug resistance efflux pump
MLQIFDQGRIIDDHHVLELREAEVPPAYRPLIRRLQLAYAEREIAEIMELEDEILDELREHERAQEWLRQQAEQAQAQVEQAQAQVEQAQVQIEQARTQAEQARTQAEQAQAEAARERERNERLLALLKQAGIEPDRTSD